MNKYSEVFKILAVAFKFILIKNTKNLVLYQNKQFFFRAPLHALPA